MVPEAFPRIDDDVLRTRVTHNSFSRGVTYVENGSVFDLRWEDGVLTSLVLGTSPAPYRCRISLVFIGGLWIPMALACTCPVRTGCKHTVATLLAARDAQLSKHDSSDDANWRSHLTHLLPESTSTTPLALGFSLRARRASGWRARWEPELTAEEAHAQGQGLELHLRPLMRGKSGAWIKGGLTWRGLEYRLEHDSAQVMWLRQLLGVYDSTRTGTGGVDHEGLNIGGFRGPLLWELLAKAPQVGIELVPDRGIDLTIGEEAHFELRVEPDCGGIALKSMVRIDGTDVVGAWAPIGDHGLYAYTKTTGGFTVELAPTAVPLPTAINYASAAPVRIPESDVEEFYQEFYPALHTAVPVVAEDGVDLPRIDPPGLVLKLTYRKDHELHAEWSWRYFGPRREFQVVDPQGVDPAEPSAQGERRDARWERPIWASVESVWPEATSLGVKEMSGIDTAQFTTDVLPVLEELDDVIVEIEGERPNYTHLEGNPHIKITTVETDRTDWFDLGFDITIDGYTIPFPNVFSALSQKREKLLLIDRTYFSLDHPAFDELRDLLTQAEELPEWEPEQPRISRYQVDFWADFEDLADETEQAVTWRNAVSGLRDLTSIEPTPLPQGLDATLRPYQHVGFEWLAFLWRHRLGGILADDMGLGKTLQTLALIAHARGREPGAPPFLIVAPTSVVPTWVNEAAKFSPDLQVRSIHHTRKKSKTSIVQAASEADVVVTSYAIARLDSEEFTAHPWAGVVLDEAQFLKNPATRAHREIAKIDAPFRLAITGTPMENSLTDLWALMSIAAPGLFPSLRKFREDYVRPIERNNDADQLAQLRRRVRPFMLRRTKEQVAADLPPKQEQLLEVELSTKHRQIYDAVLQRERQKVLGLIDDLDRNRFIVFRSLTLLRMLALAPSLVDDEYTRVGSAKLDALMGHLADITTKGHRTLVFSQFTSFLTMAAARCAENGIAYEYLDGSSSNRGAVIDSFRNGEAPVFFISLKAGGFGLTLTEADYVFMLDPWWNPAAESQAVDRTHRIGQTKNVMVYRLVAHNTIEEKVMALQQEKAALFDAVVDGDAHFSRGLSAADIRGLFE